MGHLLAVTVNETVKSDWWPTLVTGLIGAVIGGVFVIAGTLIAGRRDTKRERELQAERLTREMEREKQLQQDRLTLEWLEGMFDATTRLYYGTRAAYLRVRQTLKAESNSLPQEYRELEFQAVLAVDDLQMRANHMRSDQITAAVHEFLKRTEDLKGAKDLPALETEMKATQSAMNGLRALLDSEMWAVLDAESRPVQKAPADSESGASAALAVVADAGGRRDAALLAVDDRVATTTADD